MMATGTTIGDALRLFQTGQFSAAASACDALIEIEPNNADAFGLRGLIALQLGDSAAALVALDRAVELRPNAPALFLHRGIALRAVSGREN